MSDTVTWEDRVVAERLTLGRLGSYLAATADDVPLAMRLYEWNGAVAGALLPTVGAAEVIVRNAIDERLRGWSRSAGAGPRWFTALPLDQRGEADVAKAIARATRWGARPEVHGQVLAELSLSLSLGFWRYLVSSRYLTSLWVPLLAAAFPQGPADLRTRRAAVELRLDRMLFVRNRVAHHEPVHRRDLLADLRAAVELVAWICPDSAAWLTATSRVAAVVAQRPVPPAAPPG